MNNDAITLNAIIDDLGRNVTALTELGQDGFNSPLVTLPHELKGMTGMPMGPRRVLSDDLIWYGALRVTIYARQLLEQSEHILLQIEDEDAAQKVGNILAVVDEQFHPGDTALQVYGRLSRRKGRQHPCRC
jgi:hypothetical protein